MVTRICWGAALARVSWTPARRRDARLRVGDLERAHVEQVVRLFLRHLEGGWYTALHLNADHYRRARDFTARCDLPLKAPDALHLAVSAADGLQLITADQQLARDAEALGLATDLIRL